MIVDYEGYSGAARLKADTRGLSSKDKARIAAITMNPLIPFPAKIAMIRKIKKRSVKR